MSVEGTV